ncbi:hypothetical protein BDP55DRAFT_175215 [Colletotrichum godetiae]|uniref:Uncharacterized protein n=1 Tax=Colletotrichum godetiae TaxID=1209918 RepID=A0AAJ0AIE3_9PEZI|nr:uncharacterized protein BDP55DRAFT_175215 [Colletotrichum godetiae]KAK1674464.1 hypothetical protein BDP55DRAFT_175215 [Colletotrichum godetiae]
MAAFDGLYAAPVGILPLFLACSVSPLGSLSDTTQGPAVSFGFPLMTSEIEGRISNYNRPAIASSIMLSSIHPDTKLALTPRNNDSGSRVRSWHSTLVTDRSTFQFCPGRPSEPCAWTNPLLSLRPPIYLDCPPLQLDVVGESPQDRTSKPPQP